MKTSYVSKSKGKDNGNSEVSKSLVSSYLHLNNQSKEYREARVRQAEEMAINPGKQQSEPIMELTSKGKKKKKGKAGIVVAAVVLVAGVSVGGVFGYKAISAKNLAEEYANYCAGVSETYFIDGAHGLEPLSDSDISGIVAAIADFEERGVEDVSVVKAQLSDLNKLLKDREVVSSLQNTANDIHSQEFQEWVNQLAQDLQGYSNPSISKEISDALNVIQGYTTDYESVKELVLGTDYATMEDTSLVDSINSIYYEPNRVPLEEIRVQMLAVRDANNVYQAALAEQTTQEGILAELEASILNEDGSAKRLSKKEKAQYEEDKAAQEAVIATSKEGTSAALEAFNSELKVLAELKDSFTGGTSYMDEFNQYLSTLEVVESEEDTEAVEE